MFAILIHLETIVMAPHKFRGHSGCLLGFDFCCCCELLSVCDVLCFIYDSAIMVLYMMNRLYLSSLCFVFSFSFLFFLVELKCRLSIRIFMSSTTTGAYLVSCYSGNKNNGLFCWILICLLPKFLGTAFAFINFLLIQAIDRSPSAVRVLFGPINL